MPARIVKEPQGYIAAIRPLAGYVALLREAITHNDQGTIHDLLTGWAVNDFGAFKFPHEASAQQTRRTTGDLTS